MQPVLSLVFNSGLYFMDKALNWGAIFRYAAASRQLPNAVLNVIKPLNSWESGSVFTLFAYFCYAFKQHKCVQINRLLY